MARTEHVQLQRLSGDPVRMLGHLYLCVCVCVCARARVSERMYVYVRASVHVGPCACVHPLKHEWVLANMCMRVYRHARASVSSCAWACVWTLRVAYAGCARSQSDAAAHVCESLQRDLGKHRDDGTIQHLLQRQHPDR